MAHPSRSGSPSGAQNRRCSEQPGQSQSQRTHPSPRSAAVNAASVQPYASCTAEAGASRTVRGGAAVSTRGVASARQSRPLLPGESESEAQAAGLRPTRGKPQRVDSGQVLTRGGTPPMDARTGTAAGPLRGARAREARGRRLGSAAAAPPPDALSGFGFQRRRPAGRRLLIVALAA
jgi:hypothetical protein